MHTRLDRDLTLTESVRTGLDARTCSGSAVLALCRNFRAVDDSGVILFAHSPHGYSPPPPSATLTTMEPIPVAVIGYGWSAHTFHLPFITSLPDLFRLAVVMQRPRTPESKGPVAADDLPDSVKVTPDIESTLKSLPEGPALVVITTDNVSHLPYAKLALEAGKHVLVEKPMTIHVNEVLELAQLARSKGLVCTAYQNRRYDGDFLTLRSLLQGSDGQPGALGVPMLYESHKDRFRPFTVGGMREDWDPLEGGGMLMDLGAHLVDQLLTLFGPPESITGFVRNQRGQTNPTADDDWLAVLTYPSKGPLPPYAPAAGTQMAGLRAILGTTCMSTHVPEEQLRFRVEGTNGSYVKYGTDPQAPQAERGWTPRTHGDAFGTYEESDPASARFGHLTVVQSSQSPDGSDQPPPLAVRDIPTLPGRYIHLYVNVAEAIHTADAAHKRGESPEQVSAAADKVLEVTLDQVATTMRVLALIRRSSEEGRTLPYTA